VEGAAGAHGGATRATGTAQRVIACTFIKKQYLCGRWWQQGGCHLAEGA